jgi:SnoaL-like domain
VTADQTQQVIDRYFEVMGARGDFSQFYVDEVTWTMVDAGAQIRGAAAVRDYVIALHAQMSDVQTRRIVVSDGAAYLEGECINVQKPESPRIAYCLAYDVTGDRITAMRCYGTFGAMTAQIEPAAS